MKIDLYLPERLQQRIDSKRQRLVELHEEAFGIGSPSDIKVKVITSPPQGAGYEEILFKIDIIERQLDALLKKHFEISNKIMRTAWQLSDEDHDLIMDRYIRLMTVTDIAEKMGVSYRTVQRKLKEAKKNYENVDN